MLDEETAPYHSRVSWLSLYLEPLGVFYIMNLVSSAKDLNQCYTDIASFRIIT